MTHLKYEARINRLKRVVKVIPREHRAAEGVLMLRKWPAYRFLDPMEATGLFRETYVEAYKNAYKTNIDRERGEHIKIATGYQTWVRNSYLTQMWTARQAADMLSMPYDAYLEFAFTFALARGRKYLPQPNQLGPNKKTHDAWLGKLAEFWTGERRRLALIRMPPMAQYALHNDLGLPAQTRFRQDLVEAELGAGNPLDGFFARNVLALGYLLPEQCHRLGAVAVSLATERAERSFDAGPHEHERLGPDGLLQSCFGLPGAEDALAEKERAFKPPCESCPVRAACTDLRNKVVASVTAETGCAEPIAEHSKRLTRERVARFRRKRKLVAAQHELQPRPG
jgi:hypothetical protein